MRQNEREDEEQNQPNTPPLSLKDGITHTHTHTLVCLLSSHLTDASSVEEWGWGDREEGAGEGEGRSRMALCLSVWIIECWSVFLPAFVVQSIHRLPRELVCISRISLLANSDVSTRKWCGDVGPLGVEGVKGHLQQRRGKRVLNRKSSFLIASKLS